MTAKTFSNILDWTLIGLLVSTGLVVLGWLWVLIIAGTTSVRQVEANTMDLVDHEQRIRLIEHKLNEVSNDVAWIRHHLENGG